LKQLSNAELLSGQTSSSEQEFLSEFNIQFLLHLLQTAAYPLS